MDDKQLAKLVRKTVEKASKPKTPPRKSYDSTLDATRPAEPDANSEHVELFEIMKKREF